MTFMLVPVRVVMLAEAAVSVVTDKLAGVVVKYVVASTTSVPLETRITFTPAATDTPVCPVTLTVTAPVELLKMK